MTRFNSTSRLGHRKTGIIQGLGLGFIFVPLSTITFSTLAPHFRNEGAALFSLMRNIGSSIGISETPRPGTRRWPNSSILSAWHCARRSRSGRTICPAPQACKSSTPRSAAKRRCWPTFRTSGS
jgi:hypothetical protein